MHDLRLILCGIKLGDAQIYAVRFPACARPIDGDNSIEPGASLLVLFGDFGFIEQVGDLRGPPRAALPFKSARVFIAWLASIPATTLGIRIGGGAEIVA